MEVVTGAVCFGSHDSVVWDFPILRGPLRHQGRRTTARQLRATLGLGGLIGAVAGVGPDCAAPGSTGDRRPRFAVNVGVEVWVVGLVPWWGRGRCFPRAPPTLGMLSVSMGGPPGVLTSGWTDARGTYKYGGHTELHRHEIPGCPYSPGKRVPRGQQDKITEKAV